MKSINYIIFFCCLISGWQINAQTTAEDINTFDSSGKTALIKAVLNQNGKEVMALLEKGSKINLPEQKGLKGTPLMYAASTGNLELCELLIKNNAKINQLDINKDHALNWATYYGYVDIMNLLIKSGTDLTIKSKHGTAVDVAFRLWHHDSVAQPFKTSLLAKSLSKSETKLIKAIANSDLKTVKKLLAKNLSPNTTDELDTPILQLASQKGDYNMVKLLIDNNANVNIMNRVGQTPLSWASRFGHIDIVKYLLQVGADSNKAGQHYQLTSLIAAAVGNHSSIGELLINNKAQINHKDLINNASPLHWALFSGHTDTKFAEMLINNDADYHEKALEDNLYSAYDMVKHYKNEKLIQLIEEKDLQKIKSTLLGSWKVQEIHYQYTDTTYIVKDEDHGRFIFSDTNYALMYNPRMNKRMPFKSLSKPEPDEIISAFRSMVFNTGTYAVEKNVIHTTADIAKVPGFEGGHQFYKITHNDDSLELVMFDEIYPNGNKPEWFGKLEVKFLLIKE